jgi:hypothetical protein
MAALTDPLDRLDKLVEAALARSDYLGEFNGLLRARELIQQVRQEQAEIAEQMRTDPPGRTYGP